jgi:hypothetical protein
MAQAARRPRVMLDILAERPFLPRFLPRGDVFLRFGRSFTRVLGREGGAKSGDDASIGFTGASRGFIGAGGAIIFCASLRPFIGSSPKANLTMAPYHLNIDSAVPSHNVAGVAIRVRSAVPASRGAVPSATCRSALMTYSSRVKVIRKRCRTAVSRSSSLDRTACDVTGFCR